MRPDGEELLREDAIAAGTILDSFFRELYSPSPWRKELYGDYLIEQICLMLIDWRVPLLAGADTNIDSERRLICRWGVLSKAMSRVLRAAWNRGDEAQQERLRLLANKPKMLGLIKEADRGLHALLGFSRRRSNPERVPAGCKSISREKIYRDVWKEPASTVASRLGVSSSMLARICTELDVPRPGRGHWAKPEDRRAEAPPLAPTKDGAPTRWVIDPKNRQDQKPKANRQLNRH